VSLLWQSAIQHQDIQWQFGQHLGQGLLSHPEKVKFTSVQVTERKLKGKPELVECRYERQSEVGLQSL